jgi:exodeoxyribonuclease V alpha subunit
MLGGLKQEIFQKRLEKIATPMLARCIESEVFALVDLYFSLSLLKTSSLKNDESVLCFLCYLLAISRQGHLCLRLQHEAVCPPPSFFTHDETIQSWIEEKILEGEKRLPEGLLQVIDQTDSDAKKPLCRCNTSYYLQKNWLWETRFLTEIERLKAGLLQITSFDPIACNPMLNAQQVQAVHKALSSPISLITGGPGTGKTFTAVEIIQAFLRSIPNDEKKRCFIKVAAPTGKAAANLEKSIRVAIGDEAQIECGTIHSLLGIRSSEKLSEKGDVFFADLFILDESSMLDARLFSYLLLSMQTGGRLVLMGDKNQLPPVDAGCFFADLLELADQLSIPSTELTQCIRAEKKEIVDLAKAVYQGDAVQVRQLLKESPRHVCFSSHEILPTRERIWDYARISFPVPSPNRPDPEEILPKIEETKILSCIRKGPLGFESINEMILRRLIEHSPPDFFLAYPILIRENDYELDLFNGEVGILISPIESLKKRVLTKNDRAFFYDRGSSSLRALEASILPAFEPAYCLSVHKSQGSEYNKVLVITPPGSEVFGREVLYTAITRTKKEVSVITNEKILDAIVQKSSRKISGLHDRLRK